MPAPREHSDEPLDDPRQRVLWAASVVARGTTSRSSGEPVFTHLPALAGALHWVSREGDRSDVITALPVADVLGATWERLGEITGGRAALTELLDAVDRTGADDALAVARVLRRRARLAMRARAVEAAQADLERAYALAGEQDPRLAISIMLDRVDVATTHGDWDSAEAVVPQLLTRTEASGDPLLQAMGRNRSGWVRLGVGDLEQAQIFYEQAWALADLHEDAVVESRSHSGLALVAMLSGDTTLARTYWKRAFDLGVQLHDRGFALVCMDGVAALLSLTGRVAHGLRLSRSVAEIRAAVEQPREVVMEELAAEVADRARSMPGIPDAPLWNYTEAVRFTHQELVDPA